MLDYLVAKPYRIPREYWTNGEEYSHRDFLTIVSPIALFEDALKDLERSFPSQTALRIPESPLVCITFLIGDESGHIEPRVDWTVQL